jgi:hypothetical protein
MLLLCHTQEHPKVWELQNDTGAITVNPPTFSRHTTQWTAAFGSNTTLGQDAIPVQYEGSCRGVLLEMVAAADAATSEIPRLDGIYAI